MSETITQTEPRVNHPDKHGLKRLSDLGDQLEAFEAAVEFEAFRPELNAALTYSDGTQGGRPPFDPVMMFKILVIQTTNNLTNAPNS
jgi:IS5 family transposase